MPAAHRERVSLLRRAAPRQPLDDLDAAAMALPGQPGENGLHSRETALLAGRDAELDERDEPPVGAAPLRVDVGAEAAVRLLAGKQRAYLRALEDQRRLGRCLLVEEVTPRLRDDSRLVRPEQPVDG